MGLMLSILIVCVGVIEVLSCYEHFQYGVIHCAANVYENARRRSSVFLKYTSRRLKLLPDNSMPEYDEKPKKIFEPFEFVQETTNNSENLHQHGKSEFDQFSSIKPNTNLVKGSKKLEEKDKIQIVKTRLEKPARPKTIRSISMPEMFYTERDIQLSEIINNLAIEPIEEINVEIEDVNFEVLTKEFDKLFDEYENPSQDTNSGNKEIQLHNLDRHIIKNADGLKHSGNTKVDKLGVNDIAGKCREKEVKNFSEKVKSDDLTKSRKNIEEFASDSLKINSTRRMMNLGIGETTNLKKVVKPLQEDEKGSSFDRFTAVHFNAVTPVKGNKSKSVDLDVFPSFCKFYDDSAAAKIFLKEFPLLDESNNKLDDTIFENDTPPTEVIDKTFEEIYNDICDESLKETSAYEEIEKSVLSGFEWNAKMDSKSKAFEGSQVLCESNEASFLEEKLLSNNYGIVKEPISDGAFLKAVEEFAEFIVKDSLNLKKIKNLVFETLNNEIDFAQIQESKTITPSGHSICVIPENPEEKNTVILESLNDSKIESRERPNYENLKGNQIDMFSYVEKTLSSKEGEIQNGGYSIFGREISNPSADINLKVKRTEFDITFPKPGMEILKELENEKLSPKNFNISDSPTERNGNNEVDEELVNTIGGNVGGIVIEKNFESMNVGNSGTKSPLIGKSIKPEGVETEVHINKADDIVGCNKLEIKNSALPSDLEEKGDFSQIKKEESCPAENDNLKENLELKFQSRLTESSEALLPKHESLLALEYKEEIKSEDKKETISSSEHKELESLRQESLEKLTLKLLETIEELEKPPPVEFDSSKTEIRSEQNNYENLGQSTGSTKVLPKYETPLSLECKEGIKFECDKKETISVEHKLEKDINETKALQIVNLGESALKSEENAEFKEAGTLVLNFANSEEAESEKLNFANFDKNAEIFHVNSDSGENKIFENFTHSENQINVDNKEVKSADSAPEAFWLIFSGEYTKAMSKDWHSGHFSCWQCDEALTGQRYVLRDDHPYCIKCYESVFANVCEECNKIIGIDSKDLSYKDKHWHEACFLCNKCRVSLVDKQFGSKADKIYCGNCYDAQFASRCDGCGEIFRAGTKKMEYKTRQWHEKCFCCCVCKTPIGTKSFIPREQEIYCATCYEEKFATRCVKCNKIITSGGVTYKNEPWHRECFTCTNCNTSLAGQRFTSRDEKPYCADCFGELFAKRCTACSRPITGIGGTRFISFEDRHWHNDCFICASCKTSLVGRGFITDGDDIICPECAKQKLM